MVRLGERRGEAERMEREEAADGPHVCSLYSLYLGRLLYKTCLAMMAHC